MSIIKLIAVIWLLASLPVKADAAAFELKGITPGMSEKEAVKLYPMKCTTSHWANAPDINLRFCGLTKWTLANEITENAEIILFDDKLIELSFKIYAYSKNKVFDAINSKFGEPKTISGDAASWLFDGDVSMLAVDSGEYIYFLVETPKRRELRSRIEEKSRQAARNDI